LIALVSGHKVNDVSKRAESSPPSASPEALALLDSEPGHFYIGAWQNVVFVVWQAQATGPAVARLSRISHTMKAQHPERVTYVHIIQDRAGLPTTEARGALVTLMKELGEHIANAAVVVGGTGFWASTMRSTITGMRFIAPRAFELRLHGSVAEIVEWLPKAHRERTGVAIAPTELHRFLRLAELWPAGADSAATLWEPADADHR
jgi:hypothetical protein